MKQMSKKTEILYFSEKWKLHDKMAVLNILEYFIKRFLSALYHCLI